MKTHYAEIESQSNESDNTTYWTDHICNSKGDELHVDNDWSVITCKKCLKLKDKYQMYQKQAMADSVEEMGEFINFIHNK